MYTVLSCNPSTLMSAIMTIHRREAVLSCNMRRCLAGAFPYMHTLIPFERYASSENACVIHTFTKCTILPNRP